MRVLLATVAAALLVTGTASASPFIRYGVQDDAYLSAGPSLDPNLQTLDQLGVGLVRYMVNWRAGRTDEAAAPNQPGR